MQRRVINPPVAAGALAITGMSVGSGLRAWAIYAMVGLSLSCFGHRFNLPLTIRFGLRPLLKGRTQGTIGHAVDISAICGTLFGVATSRGFGVLQINAGTDRRRRADRFERDLQPVRLPATVLPVTAPEHGPEAAPRA